MRLIKISVRQKRISILVYSFAGFAMLLLYVAIYPSLQAQIGDYNKLINSLPKGLMKAFGADTSLNNFEGLLGTKQFGFTWPLICIFFMISFAGSSLAGEIEKSTLGLWLAAPISRLQIYWSKVTASLIGLVGFMVASVLVVIPMAAIFNIALTKNHIYALSVTGLLFGFCLAGLAFLASSIFSEKSKVYAVMGGLLLLMYVLNLLAALSSNLINLKYASFFYYYNASDLLTGRPVNRVSLVLFALIGIISLAAGSAIFNKRDVSI